MESAIGVSGAGRLGRFKSALFALWKKGQAEQVSVGRFETEWDQNVRTSDTLCRWLGCHVQPSLLSDLAYLDEHDGSLKLLAAGNATTAEWQAARQELGLQKVRFPESEGLWHQITTQLHALLKATAARSPLADLADVKRMLDARPVGVPEHHAEALPSVAELLIDVLSVFNSAVRTVAHRHFREVLERRLSQVGIMKVTSPREIKLEDPPDRDVQEYRDFEDAERARRAQERLAALIEVSTAVAAHLGELLDPHLINNDSRVQLLTKGYWANRLCLVPAFQAILVKAAPATHEHLSEAGIFRSPLSLNEVLALLPGIVRREEESEKKPVKKLRILGADLAEADAEADIGKGVLGTLGQKIRECAQNDPFAFDTADTRGPVIIQPKQRQGRRGASGRSTRETEREKALYGQLGEIFVYELLKARAVPGFDEAAWQSANRCQYLGEGRGDDSLGYDFSFNEESGVLSGRAGVLCLIEVKSSSGDADGPFQMSENEWTRAIEAHQSGKEQYVILRIARVNEVPSLADIIRDPYGLRKESKLQLVAGDFRVHTGTQQ